ncbi:TPA: hypothetical protein ACULHW_004415, partial [Escherichia coli]
LLLLPINNHHANTIKLIFEM